MVTVAEHKLDERIHSFLDRKTREFPELDRITTKQEQTNLFTRVQDLVSNLSHVAHPRHSH